MIRDKKRERAADFIHHLLCGWDHTEFCGYDYGTWSDPRPERVKELEMVNKVIDKIG